MLKLRHAIEKIHDNHLRRGPGIKSPASHPFDHGIKGCNIAIKFIKARMKEAQSWGVEARGNSRGILDNEDFEVGQDYAAMKGRCIMIRVVYTDAEVLERTAASLNEIQNWTINGFQAEVTDGRKQSGRNVEVDQVHKNQLQSSEARKMTLVRSVVEFEYIAQTREFINIGEVEMKVTQPGHVFREPNLHLFTIR